MSDFEEDIWMRSDEAQFLAQKAKIVPPPIPERTYKNHNRQNGPKSPTPASPTSPSPPLHPRPAIPSRIYSSNSPASLTGGRVIIDGSPPREELAASVIYDMSLIHPEPFTKGDKLLSKVRSLSRKKAKTNRLSADQDQEMEKDPIYDEALSIYLTLEKSLEKDPPLPDTLGLDDRRRSGLCIGLYMKGVQGEDWKDLASDIGLDHQATDLIDAFTSHHNNTTAAELVLRHWQYRFNKYGQDAHKCPYPCNKKGLEKILEKMNRIDMLQLIRG